MENKINIAELLKDCPQGMELDCTMIDNVVFEKIDSSSHHSIIIRRIDSNTTIHLTKYGQYSNEEDYKCVIFPKYKTTWEGFAPPCKFKAGDVIVSENGNIVLFSHIDTKNVVHYHCIIPTYGSFRIEENTSIGVGRYYDCVLANEQQRQRMYDKIKCSGHKYNQSTNTLEKLIEPKFKVGDKVKRKDVNYTFIITIVKSGDDYYDYVNEDGQCGVIYISKQDDWELVSSKLVEPKFKVGDRIIPKNSINKSRIINAILDNEYNLFGGGKVLFSDQNNWELSPDKFDITTLVPFESRVLVRSTDDDIWRPAIYGFTYSDRYYVVGGVYWKQCIPYEANKELLGTTNNPEEYGSR